MDSSDKIIKKFHPHPLGFMIFYLSGIALFIVAFFISWYLCFIGILVFVLGEISRRAETFYITDSGISREYKLLSTATDFAEYNKIQNLEVHQSFLQNMFGVGDIHMDTAGGDKTEVNFDGIKDPNAIEQIIREKMKGTQA